MYMYRRDAAAAMAMAKHRMRRGIPIPSSMVITLLSLSMIGSMITTLVMVRPVQGQPSVQSDTRMVGGGGQCCEVCPEHFYADLALLELDAQANTAAVTSFKATHTRLTTAAETETETQTLKKGLLQKSENQAREQADEQEQERAREVARERTRDNLMLRKKGMRSGSRQRALAERGQMEVAIAEGMGEEAAELDGKGGKGGKKKKKKKKKKKSKGGSTKKSKGGSKKKSKGGSKKKSKGGSKKKSKGGSKKSKGGSKKKSKGGSKKSKGGSKKKSKGGSKKSKGGSKKSKGGSKKSKGGTTSKGGSKVKGGSSGGGSALAQGAGAAVGAAAALGIAHAISASTKPSNKDLAQRYPGLQAPAASPSFNSMKSAPIRRPVACCAICAEQFAHGFNSVIEKPCCPLCISALYPPRDFMDTQSFLSIMEGTKTKGKQTSTANEKERVVMMAGGGCCKLCEGSLDGAVDVVQSGDSNTKDDPSNGGCGNTNKPTNEANHRFDYTHIKTGCQGKQRGLEKGAKTGSW